MATGAPSYIGQVYSGGALPTAVPRVYLTRPVSTAATEAEGQTPTHTTDGASSVPVLVLGPRVPVAGDNLVARQVGGYWVAQLGKTAAASTVVPTNCTAGCPVPTTIVMTSSNTTCTGAHGLPFPASVTFTWITSPPWLVFLGAGANTFLSTTSFLDSFGEVYHLRFFCSSPTHFQIRQVYENLLGGGPSNANILYNWPSGTPNSCSPFLLTTGTPNIPTTCPASILTVTG